MIKTQDIVSHLKPLIGQARACEHSYRAALNTVAERNDKALFIYFWQEHARMMCELEDKVRSLDGSIVADVQPAWGGIVFRDSLNPEEMIRALYDCERKDAEILDAYTYTLKYPLPVDVRALLKMHSLKIKGMHARVLQELTRMHTAASLSVLSEALSAAPEKSEALLTS
jgi:uncharacterized protein (TIGR02284 family)